MKVLRLEVHHVGCISDVELDLAGHNLFLVGGRNENGKTIAIKSLLMALCGRKEMGAQWPAKPLKDGEDEGYVKVYLSGDAEMQDEAGFVAEIHFTRKADGGIKEEFVLTDSDGDEAPEPRTLLRRLYHMSTFDPTAFDRLRSAEQKEELARLFPGLDFSDIDKKYQNLFAERQDVNRDGKRMKAQYDGMTQYKDAPETEVVVADLLAELKRLQDVNEANTRERSKGVVLRERAQQARAKEVACRGHVEDLKRQLEEQQSQLSELSALAEDADDAIIQHDQNCAFLKDEDTSSIEEQIGSAQVTNRQVQENRVRESTKLEVDSLRKKSQGLTDAMKKLDQEKAKRLKGTELPVDGLAVDATGITYQGRPFKDANKATRFLVGCMIGMAGGQPKLPLLVCEHGDGLDWETLQEFGKLLEEKGWQAVVEVTSRSTHDDEQCQVVMVDGEAKEVKEVKTDG